MNDPEQGIKETVPALTREIETLMETMQETVAKNYGDEYELLLDWPDSNTGLSTNRYIQVTTTRYRTKDNIIKDTIILPIVTIVDKDKREFTAAIKNGHIMRVSTVGDNDITSINFDSIPTNNNSTESLIESSSIHDHLMSLEDPQGEVKWVQSGFILTGEEVTIQSSPKITLHVGIINIEPPEAPIFPGVETDKSSFSYQDLLNGLSNGI